VQGEAVKATIPGNIPDLFVFLHTSTVVIPGKSSYTWTTLVSRIACLLVIRKMTFTTRCVIKSLYSAAWPGSVWKQRRLNYMGNVWKGFLKSHKILHSCFLNIFNNISFKAVHKGVTVYFRPFNVKRDPHVVWSCDTRKE